MDDGHHVGLGPKRHTHWLFILPTKTYLIALLDSSTQPLACDTMVNIFLLYFYL